MVGTIKTKSTPITFCRHSKDTAPAGSNPSTQLTRFGFEVYIYGRGWGASLSYWFRRVQGKESNSPCLSKRAEISIRRISQNTAITIENCARSDTVTNKCGHCSDKLRPIQGGKLILTSRCYES